MALKVQYTSKLLLGLGNRLKTKVFTCIKKITKMRLVRYRIMKKKRFFGIFTLGDAGNGFLEKFYVDYIFLIDLSLW